MAHSRNVILTAALLAVLAVTITALMLRGQNSGTPARIADEQVEQQIERAVDGDVSLACPSTGPCTVQSDGAEPVELNLSPAKGDEPSTWRVEGSSSEYVNMAIMTSLERTRGLDVLVECPALIPLRTGTRFTCSLQHDGQRFSVDVEMLDANGRVQWRVA